MERMSKVNAKQKQPEWTYIENLISNLNSFEIQREMSINLLYQFNNK